MIPSGTVTFLFTDIVDSSRRWEEDPEGMRRLLAVHDAALRRVVTDHGGHVFATGGDGFAVAFARPRQAAEAAVAIQGVLQSEAADLEVRMALHTGTADERDGDYFGPTVNRAARLMEIANGGQVLTSQVTARLIEGDPPPAVGVASCGTQRLRDLSAPEEVFRLTHPDLPERGPLQGLDQVPNNLPGQRTSFVGRAEEMDRAIGLLDGSRLLTITGVGGAGKTRLALQLAAAVLDQFPDGVWLVELAGVTDPQLVATAVAAGVGAKGEQRADPVDAIVDRLLGSRSLLLLDNCEHLLNAVADLTERLLTELDELMIVATSRELLGVAGEVPFQLRSMRVPAPGLAPSDALQSDAVRLFAERARAANPDFELAGDQLGPVVEIVSRLDGLPLALELAAARVRHLSPTQIAERLHDRFRLLTGGARTALPRQQTLEAAIEWSHRLLDERGQVLFRRLAAFSGSFDLDAAEQVAGFEPLDGFEVLDLIAALVDKSLVATIEAGTEVRYRLLETLRQYAADRLDESGEADAVARRHADRYRTVVEGLVGEIRGPEEAVVRARLDADHDNLRRALRWAIDAGEAETAQGLAGAAYRYWVVQSHLREGRSWAEQALAVAPPEGIAGGRAALGAGTLAFLVEDPGAARWWLGRAVELLDGTGDLLEEPARGNLAAVQLATGEVEAVLGELERQRRSTREEAVRVVSRVNLSDAYHHLGRMAELEEVMAELEDLAEQVGSRSLAIEAFGAVAVHAAYLGQMDRARMGLERIDGLDPDRKLFPGLLEIQGALVAVLDGQPEEADRAFRAGMAELLAYPQVGELAGLVSRAFIFGGDAALALGQPERAAVLLGVNDARFQGDRVRYRYAQEHVDRLVEGIVARLGTGPADDALAWGREMAFAAAVRYAVEG